MRESSVKMWKRWCKHACEPKCAYCILTSSVSFTRRICSLRSWRSLKVDCAVMEYTRAKPWPFFMYKSLIAVNCSYTAGKIKRNHELRHMLFGILYTVKHLLYKSIAQVITSVWPVMKSRAYSGYNIVQWNCRISVKFFSHTMCVTVSTLWFFTIQAWTCMLLVHHQHTYNYPTHTLLAYLCRTKKESYSYMNKTLSLQPC